MRESSELILIKVRVRCVRDFSPDFFKLPQRKTICDTMRHSMFTQVSRKFVHDLSFRYSVPSIENDCIETFPCVVPVQETRQGSFCPKDRCTATIGLLAVLFADQSPNFLTCETIRGRFTLQQMQTDPNVLSKSSSQAFRDCNSSCCLGGHGDYIDCTHLCPQAASAWFSHQSGHGPLQCSR
jgi:hypothetical protein